VQAEPRQHHFRRIDELNGGDDDDDNTGAKS
jgi:hypothetical protein